MKIHNSVGSKERFLEIFQGVNKIQLNEVATNVMQSGTQLVEKAFEELKNKQANVKQTNTQTVNDDNFVEIITNDNDGNEITFRFKVSSTEGDQDGVFNVDDAALVNFKIKSESLNVDMPENMKAVQEFNQNHSSEIMSVVGEYANFETDTMSVDDEMGVDDEMYEEAIKLIDRVPYKKGTEQMQTNKAYGDEKPTNPTLRVKSDELNQFVSEEDKYVDDEYTQDTEEEDILALPPEYTAADIPKKTDDDGSVAQDPWEAELDAATKNVSDEEVDPEKVELIHQAYDNLVAAGNQAPTSQQIIREIDRMQGNIKPVQKTRAIPKGAEAFWEGENHVVNDMDNDEVIRSSFIKTLSPEMKQSLISTADAMLTSSLGVEKANMSMAEYFEEVKKLAMQMFQQGTADLNEESEKSDYPDQIGKKFKPKSQMPKKKKKPQSVVKLSEESEIPQEYWGNPEDEMNEEKLPEPAIEPDFDSMGMGQGDDIEQLMQDKEEQGEMIQGGLADGKSPSEFNSEQIKLGLKVEMEHTDDPLVALEIALDHLTEDPEYYTVKDNPEASAQSNASQEAEEMTDELLGYKPHNVNDYSNEEFDYAAAEREYFDKEDREQNPEDYDDNENSDEIVGITEEDGMEEYQGNMGDRYQDAEGNQFTVRNKVKGGVTLQGQGGEKEIGTSDLSFLKKLSEGKTQKEVITEEQIKMARQALNKRGLTEGMTKKEAVQILIKHNIK